LDLDRQGSSRGDRALINNQDVRRELEMIANEVDPKLNAR
jgi:hypothetical protein